MDKIFKPDKRTWISPLTNLAETALRLHSMADTPLNPEDKEGLEFNPPPPEPLSQSSASNADQITKEKADLRGLVDLILKPSECAAKVEEINAALAAMSKGVQEFDSLNVEYEGSSSEDYDSETNSDDDDAQRGQEKEAQRGHYSRHASGLKSEVGGPAASLPQTQTQAQPQSAKAKVLWDKIRSLKREPETNTPESAAESAAGTLREILDERDRKHDVDFSVFYKYSAEKAKERAKRAMLREKKWHKEDGLEGEEYYDMARRTSSLLAFDPHEVFVDDAVTERVEMPLLAGPVPHKTIQKLTTLALYTSLSDEPGNFQWKSTHVMEQLTASQQAEKQTMRQYQRDGRRMEKKFPDDEFIVSVSFYQPSELATYDLKSAPEPKPGLEIELLGSHTLEDLRKMLFCQRNYACTKDCEEYEKWTTIGEAMGKYGAYLAMNIIPGDVLYINETCYTDSSDAAHAHFKTVRRWISDVANKEIDQYLESPMATTKLSDLTIRFGYPYLYLHQGDCEHIVVFTGMRLPRPVEFSIFPRHEVVGKYTTKFCRIDKEFMARWIVCGSDRFPEDPILLCNSCVEEYCFKRGKDKKGDCCGGENWGV